MTLVVRKKILFFFMRALTYTSFLLLPIWVQKSVTLGAFGKVTLMNFYLIFLVAQWFLLGKEIDYRLGIFFQVRSSLDRVIYRVLLGMMSFVFIFYGLSFLPHKWVYNLFWAIWVILGLYYSWPTRGKIIRESLSGNLGEFRTLDGLEKILLGLIFFFFVISQPYIPATDSVVTTKAFLNTSGHLTEYFWRFMTVTFYPFYKYIPLLRVAWVQFFYTFGLGLFLIVFYSVLRYLVSRRVALLGALAIISSYHLWKAFDVNPGICLTSSFSLLWIWSLLWALRSSTYKSGLFLGLINLWGALLNPLWGLLIFVHGILLSFVFLSDKNNWFKLKVLKYMSVSVPFVIIVFINSFSPLSFKLIPDFFFLREVSYYLIEKGLFWLAPGGVALLFIYFFSPSSLSKIELDRVKYRQMLGGLLALFVICFFVNAHLLEDLGFLWWLTIFSLIPLEMILQSRILLASRRELILFVFILVTLLDSHLDTRFRGFIDAFLST